MAGGDGEVGDAVTLGGGTGGSSAVGHPGGHGGLGGENGGGGYDGGGGQSTTPDPWGLMGGPGGLGGAGESTQRGGNGYDGDSGKFLGDGSGEGSGVVCGSSWCSGSGQNGQSGTAGHGGGGGGGGGSEGCCGIGGSGGGGGGGGGGGEGGGEGAGGGGSFGVFLVESAGAVVQDSSVTASDGGAGGAGAGGAFGGAGGEGGGVSTGAEGGDGGSGGDGGEGGRGGDGGGGAGGPSVALFGLTPSDAPGTTVSHGAGGAGGAVARAPATVAAAAPTAPQPTISDERTCRNAAAPRRGSNSTENRVFSAATAHSYLISRVPLTDSTCPEAESTASRSRPRTSGAGYKAVTRARVHTSSSRSTTSRRPLSEWRELGGEAEINEHSGPRPSGTLTTRVRASACTSRLASARPALSDPPDRRTAISAVHQQL